MIEKIVSADVIELKLLELMRIYLVVNISRVVRYGELVKEQKIKKVKLIEIEDIKEWKIKKNSK